MIIRWKQCWKSRPVCSIKIPHNPITWLLCYCCRILRDPCTHQSSEQTGHSEILSPSWWCLRFLPFSVRIHCISYSSVCSGSFPGLIMWCTVKSTALVLEGWSYLLVTRVKEAFLHVCICPAISRAYFHIIHVKNNNADF